MKGHKSHHHRKHKAEGGRTHEIVSGNPDVLKEAEGKEPYAKGDERKHGGRMKKKHHEMHPEGKMAKHRHDRPHRKSGGRVGSDRSPLSSAHHGGKDSEKYPKSTEGPISD
jgi:hypothetical protein